MFYLYTIAILNLMDLVLTTISLGFGITGEANPLMRYLWHANPLYFIFVKLALSILLLILAHRLPKVSVLKWRWLYATTVMLYLGILGTHVIWIRTFI
ncbi:DUF5658 family protein [Salinibacillus xinjiangensis]|uniref:DUF5658 domain-containing protein n=1 Tax=Salinibacillus xinjiangensis TaxID=1229268 RepID=A0A6G1X410_9BACI|nr:DUF5658 family protein [Salinibacillus xinjiangensis]MRG85659.1 hypothetical protein [Salinibacillus xinjiangensis]